MSKSYHADIYKKMYISGSIVMHFKMKERHLNVGPDTKKTLIRKTILFCIQHNKPGNIDYVYDILF